MKPIFAISVMCMDFMDTKNQIKVLNERAGIYHFDIMDGHFCPNIMLPPDFVKTFRNEMKLPIDAHLMVEKPGDYIESLAKAGADYISVHAETINSFAFRIIEQIESLGCKVGIILNPATPLSYIQHYLNRIDLLTIMTVDVGFSGSKFIPEMMDKLQEAKELREKNGYKYILQVDGACNKDNFENMAKHGAQAYVMGNTGLFKNDPDVVKAFDIMEEDFNKLAGEYYD